MRRPVNTQSSMLCQLRSLRVETGVLEGSWGIPRDWASAADDGVTGIRHEICRVLGGQAARCRLIYFIVLSQPLTTVICRSTLQTPIRDLWQPQTKHMSRLQDKQQPGYVRDFRGFRINLCKRITCQEFTQILRADQICK